MLSTDDQLIDLRKAGGILGVSVDTVRRYISEGHLPGYKIAGHTIRVNARDVLAMAVPVPSAHRAAGGDQ